MAFQIGSTLLDACVLSVLDKGDTYGYEITQTLKDILGISESTLYPVLKRLQKDGALSTYDKPFQGRNRRYYTITKNGQKLLQQYRIDWKEYSENVNKLLTGGGYR